MIVKILYQVQALSPKLKYDLQSKLYNYQLQFAPMSDPISESIAFLQTGADIYIVKAGNYNNKIPEGFKILAYINEQNTASFNDVGKVKRVLLIIKNQYQKKYEILNSLDTRRNYAKVFITGFGPGDPDLLTIKALKAIKMADAIFFDDLIDHHFLKKYKAEKIYVGKRKGKHSYSQDKINEFLYQSSVSGKITVRLKGGDPLIFGRGGEEFDYLRERFIDVEVIPGITAAFGAAASTGISLTQRGVSSSVAFCTGFPRMKHEIPGADTLVFYMSASNLQETAQLLIEKGRSGKTPVALIRNATLANQESEFASLFDVASAKVALASPMIAIIGNVAVNKHFTSVEKIILPEIELPGQYSLSASTFAET